MSDSSIRRREFIAGAAATTGLAFTSKSFASSTNSLLDLNHDDFVEMLGHTFETHGESDQGTRQQGSLVLKKVNKHDINDAGRPSHLRSESFSLYFESQDLSLADGIHSISGCGFSSQRISLVEMLDQRQAGRRHYEAVFN